LIITHYGVFFRAKKAGDHPTLT